MVQVMFECPDTGELMTPIRRFARWDGGGNELVSIHCSKCSNTHVLSRADALLAIAGEPADRES